ncbi:MULTISPECIES: Orn/Lys/Arg family decarboxylase [unclassified Blastococcus]
MDHSRAPVLEALQEFRRRGDVVFGPPGHKQGRGVDPRVLEVVGAGVFASDVLTLNGLDDRRESQGVTTQAPRDAFFARVEQVPVSEAVGRVSAEMVSPYPPGVPVLAPGERITAEAVDYLTTGVRAGMLVPDAADPSMESLRVVRQ